MGVDAVSRKYIGTRNGKQRLSTLLSHKNAKKRNTKSGNPSREEMRECIKSQWCWWCDSGPWRCLAAHTSKAHFIMAADIRELAYLFKQALICSPEHSHNATIRFKKIEEMGLMKRGHGEAGNPHVYSTAGRDWAVEKGRRAINSPAFRSGSAEYNESKKGSHPCPICGNRIETSRPVHCSPQCSHIAHSEASKKSMTPERIAQFKTIRYHPDPKEQSKRAHAYWDNFKELPLGEQRRLNLEKASSRRIRVIKLCVICGSEFDVIPSHAGKAVTCCHPECKQQNQSNKAKGRRHTSESIAKMSAIAKERHIKEPLFGRMVKAL